MSKIKDNSKPDKPRLSNDQFIALSCELAHERVEEEHTGDECADLLAKDGAESCYTEDGQEFFDVMYDHYQDILSKYLDGQEPDKAEPDNWSGALSLIGIDPNKPLTLKDQLPEPEDEIKYDYVCAECEGDLMVDAWVVWSIEKQDFVISEVFVDQPRNCFHNKCNGVVGVKEIEMTQITPNPDKAEKENK